MNEPTRWICLLRGINVGGRHKLPMALVRETLQAAGLADVQTWIQSGNIAFTTSGSADELAEMVRERLESVVDFPVPTVVLDAARLHRIVAENPFCPDEPKLEHIVFFQGGVPGAERESLTRLVERTASQTRVHIGLDAIYLLTPEGFANSTLVAKWSSTRSSGTARNLATVARLQSMAQPPADR